MEQVKIRRLRDDDWRKLTALRTARRARGKGLVALERSLEQALQELVGEKAAVVLSPCAAVQPDAWKAPTVAYDCGDGLGALIVATPLGDARRLLTIALGGSTDTAEAPSDAPPGRIELRLVSAFLDHIAGAMPSAFERRNIVAPTLRRLDAPIGEVFEHAGPVDIASFHADVVVDGVSFRATISLSTICLKKLEGAAASESDATESGHEWKNALAAHLSECVVELRACVFEENVSLERIVALTRGGVMDLRASLDSEIVLSAGPDIIHQCELGQADGRYNVRVGSRPASPRSQGGKS